MIPVDAVLGNRTDPIWKHRLEGASVDILELSRWDAQKSRLRKETRNGRCMAIALDRSQILHDGDVLLWDAQHREAVVCAVELCDVLLIDLRGLTRLPVETAVSSAIRLGHALGNQHWPAVILGQEVCVPVTVDRAVVASVLKTHHPEGVSWCFVAGRDIADRLNPDQARRLFGGGEMPAHDHGNHHGRDTAQPGDAGHGHTHPAQGVHAHA